ncbi:MAG TPA: M1 family metallopeptidase [Cytophagaceae bacterium]|jgi:aminopeptidase N|nr:M1 family metallopeptidase [Cytophagaceae bacterium]
MSHRVFLWRLFFALSILTSTLSAQTTVLPVYDRYDSLRGALNPLRACYDVSYYNLNLQINPADSSVKGFNEIHFSGITSSPVIQVDLFSIWTIDSIVQNHVNLSYKRDSDFVFITLQQPLGKGDKKSIAVYYHGHPVVAKKAPWDGGFVWSKDSLGNYWTGVACEGMGASSWWPCKDHLSDEPDSMDMSFDVPQSYTAVGNGRLVKQTELPNHFTRFHWHVSYPINSYNVTVNVAKYAFFKETHQQKNGTLLDLQYYVLAYNLEKAKTHFQQVHKMLDIYEKLFTAYPFPRDSYKMVETSYWGMEHQSAISYGNNYKNDVIDWDYIIIHESAHEWWGNNVSCKDHADMWIHESFATYTEVQLMETSYNYETAVKYLYYQRPRIDNEVPIIGPQDVNYQDWVGSDMYYKGAWALHTLRHYINNDTLWYGVFPAIQKRFALQTITSDDLISFMSSYFKQDLKWFFKYYFYKKDLPVLQTEWIFKKKKAIVNYKWANCGDDFKLPVYFIGCDQRALVLHPKKKLTKQVFPISEGCTKMEFVDYLYYIDQEEVKDLK